MGDPDLRPGQVVTSLAGRDRGRKMVVLGVLDERYVLVADGDLRRSDRPKRKNRRHLQPQNEVDAVLARKIAQGRPLTDQDIREALRRVSEGERHDEERRD